MATNGECCDGGPAAPRAAPRAARLAESRRFAQRFYALGDEIRLEVLGLLRGGERCVCELTAHLELAQSRLSFHLKVLKDAGLVSHRREGRWSYYALDAEALRELEAFLGRVPPVAGPCCQALEPAAAAVSRRRKEQR
jgi:ArsR family transcriptional regulator